VSNRYLEKIAILNFVGGYNGANDGDKVGGTILGGGIGGAAGTGAGYLVGAGANKYLKASPSSKFKGLVLGMGVGGYVGGRLYSLAKKKIQGKDYKSNSRTLVII